MAYVMPYRMQKDLILRRGWTNHNEVSISPAKKSLYLHRQGVRIRSQEGKKIRMDLKLLTASAFSGMIRRRGNGTPENEQVRVFAATIANINKALAPKKQYTKEELALLLPEHYR